MLTYPDHHFQPPTICACSLAIKLSTALASGLLLQTGLQTYLLGHIPFSPTAAHCSCQEGALLQHQRLCRSGLGCLCSTVRLSFQPAVSFKHTICFQITSRCSCRQKITHHIPILQEKPCSRSYASQVQLREGGEGTSEDGAIVYGGRIAGREITTLANKPTQSAKEKNQRAM